MNISKFSYILPKNKIAQKPISPRDHSKLLLIDRKTKNITSYHFYNLVDILKSDDVLVLNKTKVFPARLFGKKETGGKVELLLIKHIEQNIWEVLAKPSVKIGTKILFGLCSGKIISKDHETLRINFNINNSELFHILDIIGHTPIPPYISTNQSENKIKKEYQTIYAKVVGSAAAPTAGFHFTNSLIKALTKKGVQIEYLTLHVGLGTFSPIREKNIKNHKMHSEYFELDSATVKRLNKAKSLKKRIIAVGTTTTRTLETCSNSKGVLKAKTGETDIFIYPPYKFKFVDGIITNFHLPKTTLLALISAFVSYPNTKEKFESFNSSLVGKAYKKAIKENYRFYSFGDSCFIN